MVRPLLITIACGYVVALACFAAAFAIAGPGFAPWSAWHGGEWGGWGQWGSGDWRGFNGPPVEGDGPATTRELAWNGGDELRIGVPASVTYTQGPMAHVTVSGPKGTVDQVVLDDGRFSFDRRVRHPAHIQVTITAPSVREFYLMGAQDLNVSGFDQDDLEVHAFGSGDVKAQGRARSVEVHIAGSGEIDLGAVAAEEAEVHIAGSGKTVVAARDRADIHIAGSGDVVLAGRPAKVSTHIAGSGRVIEREPEATPAPAPTTPAPAPAPKAGKKAA